MKLDRRSIILTLIFAELALMVAFVIYAEVHSWDVSGGNWILTGYLAVAMLFNEAIDRLMARSSRRRGSPR
jgi:uncharacterized membrane protein